MFLSGECQINFSIKASYHSMNGMKMLKQIALHFVEFIQYVN